MNRQMKRMQERAERQQKRGGGGGDRSTAPSVAARRQQVAEKGRKRTGARQFLKEVRQELKKVDWPSRAELISYTIVVLATLIVTTLYVAGLDLVFSKSILDLLS